MNLEIFKMLVVFMVYALLIGGIAFLVIRFMGNAIYPSQGRGFITVLDRLPLAPNKGLVILRIGDKVVVLAVVEQDVKVLMELSWEEVEGYFGTQEKKEPSISFRSVMEKVLTSSRIGVKGGEERDKEK